VKDLTPKQKRTVLHIFVWSWMASTGYQFGKASAWLRLRTWIRQTRSSVKVAEQIFEWIAENVEVMGPGEFHSALDEKIKYLQLVIGDIPKTQL
jgi:hypothetical protein